MRCLTRGRPFRIVPCLVAAAPFLVVGGCGDLLSPDQPGNLVPLTVDEDPSLPALALNGSLFHLEEAGLPGAPVIVFLHGGPGGDYRSMRRLLQGHGGEPLTASHRVILWDQRSSGLSRRHDANEITIDLYTEDLLALTDYFSPNEPVVLVGHSWGGMYATEFINRHPERVAGAVLIEPGPLTGERMKEIEDDYMSFDLTAEWLNDYAWSQLFFTPDDHARWDYQYALGYRDSQPKYYQDYSNDPAPYWRWGAAAGRYVEEDGLDENGDYAWDFTENLPAYSGDVLVIASGLNEVLGEAFQLDQAEDFPRAEVVVVPDVGHDLEWKKAGEVLDLIRAYLANMEFGEGPQ
ncbi:MAG: alpha/beta hydrolase [Gemmatimonadota bacterium]